MTIDELKQLECRRDDRGIYAKLILEFAGVFKCNACDENNIKNEEALKAHISTERHKQNVSEVAVKKTNALKKLVQSRSLKELEGQKGEGDTLIIGPMSLEVCR